jgi:hypothetical protein
MGSEQDRPGPTQHSVNAVSLRRVASRTMDRWLLWRVQTNNHHLDDASLIDYIFGWNMCDARIAAMIDSFGPRPNNRSRSIDRSIHDNVHVGRVAAPWWWSGLLFPGRSSDVDCPFMSVYSKRT